MSRKQISILGGLAVALLAGFSAGEFALCGGQSGANAPVDFSKIVQEKNAAFLSAPFPNTKAGIAERRSRLQDDILREFDRCPDCFVKKYVGAQRTYLFDAIVDGDTVMRIGTPFDGGKWICTPQALPSRPIVYSFGIGDNISFDMDMAGLFGSDVFMFDPSPSVVKSFERFTSGRQCGRGHLYFQPVGLGPVSSAGPEQWKLVIEGKACTVQSFGEIAGGHHHARVDILKMDIEGGEFAALKNILASQTLVALQVRQLLVEFHFINDAAFADFIRIVGGLKKQGFLLFRKEFNPYAADKCAEYAFVRQ
jgi:hypothetical protein